MGGYYNKDWDIVAPSLKELYRYTEKPEWVSDARWRMELSRRAYPRQYAGSLIDPDRIHAPDNSRPKRWTAL